VYSHHLAESIGHSADEATTTIEVALPRVPEGSWGVQIPFSHLRVQVGGGPEPPKQKERHEKADDFYANVGDAIRTLREDVPTCLRRELNCAIPSL
jgi:hypothetical protein